MTPLCQWDFPGSYGATLVNQPSGGGGGGSNIIWRSQEPVGYTQVANRDFNTTTEDGWTTFPAGGSNANFTIISDSTGPRSPNNVGQINYPTSPNPFDDGTEPVKSSKGASGNKMYVCHNFKYSSNWVGHPSGTNKIVHYFMDGGQINKCFSVGYGDASNPLAPAFGLQQLASNYNFVAQGGGFGTAASGWLFPNQTGHINDELVRGHWYQWEYLIQLGTAGNADGRVDWWLGDHTNNTFALIGSYTGIPFISTSAQFVEIDWAPTWGGFSGATLTVDQQEWMDAYYASQHA